MSARSFSRGHPIAFSRGAWRYKDGVKLDDDSDRPCSRCGRPPTPEGYDACLGFIPDATSACCGHGVSEPILVARSHKPPRADNTKSPGGSYV